MKTTMLLSLVGALICATTSVLGHGVLVEPPVRVGMGKVPGGPPQGNGNLGKKLVGERAFRNLPGNGANSGCGNAATTGNPGQGEPKVTWTAGQQAKVCWEITLAHPEQAGVRSPGVRVSIAYTNNERFDANVMLKDLDAGPNGIYCSTFTVPAGKTTNAGILQWSWVSIPDGGAYVGCADIRIKAATNEEGCAASMWLGAVGNCGQGNGMFDISPMLNQHPGGNGPINQVCGAGANTGNWLGKSGSHSQYQTSLTNAKGDMKYGQTRLPRLGPAANCPANAKTPPKLPPQQGGGGGGGGQPQPTQPTNPPPQQPVTTKPPVTPQKCTTPGKCNCSPGIITKTGLPGAANGNILTYPITVGQSANGAQKLTIPCSNAHKGYANTKQSHIGFEVKCSANVGRWYLSGGRCAAYPKCGTVQNNPGPVCTTGRYNQNAANEPCTSSPCKTADAQTCCIGSPVGGGGNTGGNNGGNNGGNTGGNTGGTCSPNSCIGLTTFTSQGGSCGMANRQGATSITPNGQCNRMPGSTAYYKLGCNGNNVLGNFGCKDPSCNECATYNFQILASEIGQCVNKKIQCDPGQANSCQNGDVWITRQCVADGASTWAVSAFTAAVVMANVA